MNSYLQVFDWLADAVNRFFKNEKGLAIHNQFTIEYSMEKAFFTSVSNGCGTFWQGEIAIAGCNYEKVQSRPSRKLQISWPSTGSDLVMCLVNIAIRHPRHRKTCP